MSTGYINIPAYGSPSWKDPVATAFDLPTNGNSLGDARVTINTDLIYIWNGTSWVIAGGAGGTVTSVAMTVPSFLTISGSPITTSGTLTVGLATEANNTVFAGPSSGGPLAPTFRLLTSSDIPALSYVSSVGANAPLSSTGGLTPVLSISQSGVATDGYLSSVDWNTFNNKQSAGSYITALTGDVSASGPGSAAATLATVNSDVGSFTYSSITVNAKGLITAASSGAAPTGTVTSVSVVTANGLAGTVATPTTTPAITLSTTVVGLLKGNATAISAAVAGTDYQAPISTSSAPANQFTNGFTAPNTFTYAQPSFSNLSGSISAAQMLALPSGDLYVGNGSNQPAAVVMSGDVTINNTGVTAIGTNKVTNTQLAQMPATTIKGNNTGGTANASDLTVLQVNNMLGDILANGTVPFAADQSLGTHKLTNVVDPTAAQDAATKNYVDVSLAALNPATACYAATTANISGTYLNGVAGIGATFVTTATGVFTVDGVTPPLNARILIKNQTSGFQNGIYNITTLGSIGVPTTFTRASDYNTPSDVNSAGLIPIINGTVNALSSWQQIATVTTIGTDSLVFSEFTANPSLYLLKANNLSDVASASTSFNNISPMTTLGDTIYGGSSGTGSRLAGNVTATKNFLVQTGTGAVSAAPSWGTIAAGDVPTLNQNTTGTASNITATSNSTLTSLPSLTSAATLATIGTITTGVWNGTVTNGFSVITSGTTYTTPAGITTNTLFKFILLGGGGGGGGIAVANGHGCGGGGGGCCILYKTGLTPSTAYTIAIGAGGAQGTAAPTAGGAGGNTTLTISATTYTAGGGGGGPGAVSTNPGGTAGTSTNGTINIVGQYGGGSGTASAAGAVACGGSTGLGYGLGGIGSIAFVGQDGFYGTGFGGGGAGAGPGSGIGGTGAQGAIIVEWKN